MTEQRNLILAIALSLAILLGFQYFFAPPPPPPAPQAEAPAARPGEGTAPALPQVPGSPQVPQAATTQQLLAQGARLKIETPRIAGSIALTGGLIDDVILTDYRQELDADSDKIRLLNPAAGRNAYFAEFGWVSAARDVALPGRNTVWTADGDVLTPQKPVTLSWDNGQGLIFRKEIAVDDNFMFTVKQSVVNNTTNSVELFPYGLVSRSGTPDVLGYYILHEGPLGVIDGTLEEINYDDLREAGKIEGNSTGGWVGITDKYWLAALAPEPDATINTRFGYRVEGDIDKYQADYLGGAQSVAPGGTASFKSYLFAGAKEVGLLDSYAESLGITNFDLAIDFGWFYFLTKPFFYSIEFLNGYLGNFGLAILAFTVLVKLVMFPLANKSYKSMSGMKKLQPEMTRLRDQFKDDKARLNQELMALYKREKINPASGCLPILVQIPVFFALYKVLFVSIEMRHAPFFGWISDLSAPDPTTIFNLFGLIPWDPPTFLMIGVWPLIMGLTMWLQQRLNPQPADPIQAKMMTFLPVVFTFLLASFPAGLVIYWAWNNVLSIAQQRFIMYKMGVN